ncbi:conserved hypothetical protein [Gloeothece citriformis PCC 7424]|uniref:RNase H type-1 domain-containing protein n=1 Tax=Gloeothece citriformis (strain PCC 7424) TaxID=65393 RepID=B7KGX9_GLOC7|nr:reverse transcriptase-like protein [Gloeothece citriformis]ACK73466.1 conserved hypothetical protein [Gloeothece citriformis PCC 7424]
MSESTSPQIQVIDTPIMLFNGTTVSKTTAGAAAAVLLMPNGRRYTVSQFLSKASKGEAEYQGLIIGLQKAQKLGIRQLDVKGDSKVLFHQIQGLTTIKEDQLLRLYNQALKLIHRFEKVSFELISPEQNRSAITAVNRCMAEALGVDSQPTTSTPPHISPHVARLIKLGSQASDKDYKNLTVKSDDFSIKSLSQLRELVPNSIRDEIALKWDGKDEHLTEIYRWYLRGLSPTMAIRKVEIDTDAEKQLQHPEKLPWEGELIINPDLENEPRQGENSYLSSTLPNDSLEIWTNPKIRFPLIEEIEENQDHEDFSFISELPDAPITEIDPDITLISAGENSLEKVIHIVDLIDTLSLEQKTHLVQELVKSPDVVNLILKAIAAQMTGEQK